MQILVGKCNFLCAMVLLIPGDSCNDSLTSFQSNNAVAVLFVGLKKGGLNLKGECKEGKGKSR